MKNKKENNKIFEYQLNKEEVTNIQNELRKLKMSEVERDQDSSSYEEKFLYIRLDDVSVAFYGYKTKKKYKKFYKYVHTLIKDLEKESKKPVNEKLGDNFSLRYTVRGSMFPVNECFRITADGKCYFSNDGKTIPFISEKEHSDLLKYQLSEKELNQLIDSLINKNDFFSLPVECDEMAWMDANTTYLTISYKGKVHTIGGYASFDYEPYKASYEIIYKLLDKIKKKNNKEK